MPFPPYREFIRTVVPSRWRVPLAQGQDQKAEVCSAARHDVKEPVMTFHVDSEVGRLKQVVVHRPGLELSRLTPQNVDDLLFDDVMWAARAREEHDAFAQKLKDKGVEVHLFADLLADVLDDPGGSGVRPRAGRERAHGRAAAGRAAARARRERRRPHDGRLLHRRHPQARPAAAQGCVAALGLPRRLRLRPDAAAQPPVPARQHGVRLRRPLGPPDGQAGPPARDWCTRAPSGTSTRCSAMPVCTSTTATTTSTTSPPPCEGGDILVIGNGAVMIGMGERTTPQGIGMLVRGYFATRATWSTR